MTSQPSEPDWQRTIPISGSHQLPPDPHVVDSISRNHRLETAIADLVDNSVDAQATAVLIRLVTNRHRVTSLYVVDDGRGISESDIDPAMRIGGVRRYGKSELGHFGLGLKAASFSQADSLTLISHAKKSTPVGRRWLQAKANSSFTIDVVDTAFCERELDKRWPFGVRKMRTIVRWDHLRAVPPASNQDVAQRFVHDAVNRLQQHLGLIFHRIIADSGLRIGIDVHEARSSEAGPLMEVEPIDPFDYPRSGLTDYPKELDGKIHGTDLRAVCHIWPGRSQLSQFRLFGEAPERHQGLYFYRHNRLVQAGGWNGLEVARKDLQLARIRIDIDDKLLNSGVYLMNPEKTRVATTPPFATAMQNARASDETTLDQYTSAASEAFRQANKRQRQRAPIAPLGKGVPPKLRKAFQHELKLIPGLDDVDLVWEKFADDKFFSIDRANSIIRLNIKYRKAPSKGQRRSPNDDPVLKTLLFLLVERLFHGSRLGAEERDSLELWQALLTAAAREELQ